MTENLIEMKLEPRICECCNSSEFESVWSSESIIRKKIAAYRFRVNIVVCKKCGFCFVSPCPTSQALNDYYEDGLSRHEGISLAYSVDVRVNTLKKYSVPSGIYAEIGGDRAEEFHKNLSSLFKTIWDVELTKNIPKDFKNLDQLPSNSADVIAHYDVLEHVPDVRKFLDNCHRVLKENGIMICEMPDIRLYPRNLLLTVYEHVNHFSVTTLATIAKSIGLDLIDVDHQCSRPYGFLSVYAKNSDHSGDSYAVPSEHVDSVSCIRGGVRQIQLLKDNIILIRDRLKQLDNQKKSATLWGVTEFLKLLLKDFKLPDNAVVVDSDPRRKNHLEDKGIEVFQPNQMVSHIGQSELLAIFAPRYSDEIIEWISDHTGRRFSHSELIVAGTGPSGESLI